MPDKRIALVTGANQGVGLQVAKELVANGVTVLVGARNFERGEAAAREIGAGAIALQLDVTDRVSTADAAERVHKETRLSRIPRNAIDLRGWIPAPRFPGGRRTREFGSTDQASAARMRFSRSYLKSICFFAVFRSFQRRHLLRPVR